MKYIKKISLFFYVYVVLTKNDIKDLLNKPLTKLWNFFGNIMFFKIFAVAFICYMEFLLVKVMYLTITQMPFPNIILGVFFTMFMPVFAISILEK